MLRGDIYRHYGGGKYVFHAIALPISLLTESVTIDKDYKAYHTEEDIPIRVVESLGVTFVDWHGPLVIYESDTIWARPVDMFFGHVALGNGVWSKRFTKTSVV